MVSGPDELDFWQKLAPAIDNQEARSGWFENEGGS
jgi:hypothetical protein